MRRRNVLGFPLAAALLLAAFVFVPAAMATVVPTEAALAVEAHPDAGAPLDLTLERARVVEALTASGVGPVEAMVRVAALTDREVRSLASGIEALPAGGTSGGDGGGGGDSNNAVLPVLVISSLVSSLDCRTGSFGGFMGSFEVCRPAAK